MGVRSWISVLLLFGLFGVAFVATPACDFPSCPRGQEDCNGLCVDLTSSKAHCGTCGNVCATGLVCQKSACVPPPACVEGLVLCGDKCIDPQTSRTNCGARVGKQGQCGEANPTPESDAGSADPAMMPSATAMSPTLPKLPDQDDSGADDSGANDSGAVEMSDAGTEMPADMDGGEAPPDLGSAGTACTQGQVCAAGACANKCPGSLVNCDGVCIDPSASLAHCGATEGCGGDGGVAGAACMTGDVCASGTCGKQCPTGFVQCDGMCVEPLSSRRHCGATAGCGAGGVGAPGAACDANQVCAAGACSSACPMGLLTCSGTCIDPLSSRAYCGATPGCGAAGGNAGAACGPGFVCAGVAGCQLSCQPTRVACGGTCIDPLSNPLHCGATAGCGAAGMGSGGQACPMGNACSSGVCIPVAPFTIDQLTGNAVTGSLPTFRVGQTFLATKAGRLTRIDVWAEARSAGAALPSDTTVEVYAVAGGLPTGAALATSATVMVPVLAGMNSFTFATPAILAPGTTYAAIVTCNGANQVNVGLSTANPYAGGTLVWDIPNNPTAVAANDLRFQAFVAP